MFSVDNFLGDRMPGHLGPKTGPTLDCHFSLKFDFRFFKHGIFISCIPRKKLKNGNR
jgi:hypothetical protein